MLFLKPYIPYIVEGAILLLVYYIFHKVTSKKSNLMYYLTIEAVLHSGEEEKTFKG